MMSLFDEWFKTMPIKENDKSVCSMAFDAGLEAAAQKVVALYPSYGPMSHLRGLAEEIRALKEES